MNVVGIYLDTGKIFESQSFAEDKQKVQIAGAIQKDAVLAGSEIEIVTMTDDELEASL